MTSEKEKDYIMETTELFNLDKINYNCTECSSPIEIISINENKYTIEFKCIKNIHRGNMLIRNYLEKIKIFIIIIRLIVTNVILKNIIKKNSNVIA